jgi:signal transduction histidine kinase
VRGDAVGSDFYYLEPIQAARSAREDSTAEILSVLIALNGGKSWRELCDLLFETLPPLIPVDRIGIAMLEGEHHLRSRYVRSRLATVLDEGMAGPICGSSLRQVVSERKIRVISDLQAYAASHPASPTAGLMVSEGMRSSLTLPLLTCERVMGVVFFTSTMPGAYNASHIALVQNLALALGTALQRAELMDSLREANERLQTLDELKSNFLNTMSHELRTPLALILGYAATLEDELQPTVTCDQRQYIRLILEAGDRLNGLLRDLLDFTALDAGKLLMAFVPIDLGDLVGELVEEWAPRIHSKGLDLEWRAPPAPCAIACDPPHLARAIASLVENAWKFTPAPGLIHVSAGEEQGKAFITVADSGPGLPEEVRARVFDRFYQADNSTTRRFPGIGLGLPLAQAIAQAHGGTIDVHASSSGTKFTLRLPLRGAKDLQDTRRARRHAKISPAE